MKLIRFLSTAWQLFWDPKVPGTLKLFLPILALIYWLSPIDLVPFFPLDDLVVLTVALKLFVELAQGRNMGPVGQPSASAHHRRSNLEDDSIVTTWRVVDDDES